MKIKHRLVPDRKLSARKVYVWDVGLRALDVFTRLSSRLSYVSGFVSPDGRYAGERFMNVDIVSCDGLDDDAVVVVADESYEWALKNSSDLDLVRISDALVPVSGIKNPVMAGCGAKCWEIISKHGLCPKQFIEPAESVYSSKLMGLKVTGISNSKLRRNDSVFITAEHEEQEYFLLSRLMSSGCDSDVYIDELFTNPRWGTDPFVLTDDALKKGKRIILVAENEEFEKLAEDIWGMYCLSFDRTVTCSESGGTQPLWALADENPDDSVVIMCIANAGYRADAIEVMKDMGYPENRFAALQSTYLKKEYLTGRILYERDSRCGVSIDFTGIGGTAGWMMYGNEDNADIRIMALGGSTTSEILSVENWASKLRKRLLREGINAVIYNGAHPSNDAQDEKTRFLRSAEALKPDIVISMSGFNNREKKNSRFDMTTELTPYEAWVRTEMQMKEYASLHSVDFYAFLQPMNLGMGENEYSLLETFRYLRESRFGKETFRPADGIYEGVINLSDMFYHMDEMYIDSCHYSDMGSGKLADAVYEHIKTGLERR